MGGSQDIAITVFSSRETDLCLRGAFKVRPEGNNAIRKLPGQLVTGHKSQGQRSQDKVTGLRVGQPSYHPPHLRLPVSLPHPGAVLPALMLKRPGDTGSPGGALPVLQGRGGLLHRSGERREKSRGLTGAGSRAGPGTPRWAAGAGVVPWGRLGLPSEDTEGRGPGCGTGGPRSPVGLGGAPRALLPGKSGGWALAFPMSGPGGSHRTWLQGPRLGHGLQARTPASPGSLFWSILASQTSAAEVTRLKQL